MDVIYLDHAAATPMDPAIFKAMEPYFAGQFYNPSAMYMAAKKVGHDMSVARAAVAGFIGARPIEIVFTAGGSEANNLAVRGIMDAYPGKKIIVSAVEHDSVLAPARQYRYGLLPVKLDGMVDAAKLADCIDDQTVLVSIMYANNEVGTIQPIRDVAAAVADARKDRKRRAIELPLYLHTDAAQAGNYLDIHAARLGVDLMSINGGKIYGPKQSGALYVRSGVTLQPLVRGGGQERGLRSGTENVAGIIGLAKALEIAQAGRRQESDRLQKLQGQFLQALQSHIPTVVVNGSLKKRLPNNIHVTLPGQDNERLLFALDEQGVQAAAGSACSASSDDASHVLRAMGLSEAAARSSLRFTMGRSTTQEDVTRACRILAGLIV